MGSALGKRRTNVEDEKGSALCKVRTNEEKDRLSMLPEDLIHKLLSFISIKHVIQTSVLSTRWRYMWTSTPCLNFSSDDFRNLAQFMEIVPYVLSHVNNQTQVHSVHLSFSGKETSVFYKSLMNDYLHNVQQLTITFTSFPSKTTFPDVSHFNCKSLNHLTMAGYSDSCMISLKSSFFLPSLTTLYLDFMNLYDQNIDKDTGLFCKCANLMTLTIRTCKMMGSKCLSISHPRLANLTLVDVNSDGNVVNVDAPQLKNLTIINCIGEHLISSPNLGFLHYNAYTPSLLFIDGLPSLEKANLCIYKPFKGDAPKIACLLRQLYTVKFLTLNLGIIQLLSSCVKVKSKKPSPFTNLKSLNGLPESAFGWKQEPEKEEVTESTEVLNLANQGPYIAA